MSGTTEETVRAFLVDQIGESLRAVGLTSEDVTDDTDLLRAGIVDSLGVLELFSTVSDRFGIDGDWEDYEPEDILVVGAFCRYVVFHARSGRDGDR